MTAVPTRERGELERAVLRLLRDRGEALSVRGIQEQFGEPVPAYTTLMTVLTRLEKKGEVLRSGDSPRKVRFHAARSDEQHASETMLSALGHAGDREAALLAFAGRLDAADVALLDAAFSSKRTKR